MPEEMLGEVDRRPGATEAEEAAEAEEAEVPEDRATPATPSTPIWPRFTWPDGRVAGWRVNVDNYYGSIVNSSER